MLGKERLFNKDEGAGARRDNRFAPYSSSMSPSTSTETPKTDFGAASPDAPLTASLTPSEPQGAKLIVGPNIKMKGVEIADCDTLVVEGRIEATVDSRLLQIAENGSFTGNVGIDIAEIRGEFKGELTVRKRLVIHSTGKVSGKVRYAKIVIEEGGELTGDVGNLGSATASIAPAPKVAAQA
jgi:cytoskeletal protein CcmA (bactofilin family)